MGNSLELFDAENDFVNRTLVTQAVEPTINPWFLMKLKSFYMAKDAKNKKQNGKVSLPNTYLIDDYYLKEVDVKNNNWTLRKQTIQLKWNTELNRILKQRSTNV